MISTSSDLSRSFTRILVFIVIVIETRISERKSIRIFGFLARWSTRVCKTTYTYIQICSTLSKIRQRPWMLLVENFRCYLDRAPLPVFERRRDERRRTASYRLRQIRIMENYFLRSAIKIYKNTCVAFDDISLTIVVRNNAVRNCSDFVSDHVRHDRIIRWFDRIRRRKIKLERGIFIYLKMPLRQNVTRSTCKFRVS